jgi:amino-acid N-acetyltransferase
MTRPNRADSSVSIERARPEQWPQIEDLLRARALPLEGAKEHLSEFLVAVDSGGVLGAAALEVYAPYGLLRSVAVVDDRAGKGLGTALVRALLERARSGGVRDVFLLTTTAAEWFPRFGFAVARREELPEELNSSEELRGACPRSAIAMRAGLR